MLTTNPTGTAETSVEKRFSQFNQFHEQLTLLCPGLIVPPPTSISTIKEEA
jgi:hypothetical protein